MDLTYLHLSLNHVAVIGVVFGFSILLISAIARSTAAARVGLGLLVLSAVVAVPVYLTGESAEEIVERLSGFSEVITEQHESAAAFSIALVMISGLLALVTLLLTRWRESKVPRVPMFATLLVSLVTTTSMLWTANLGGQVRHTEIRASAQNNPQGSEAETPNKGSSKKDDDD